MIGGKRVLEDLVERNDTVLRRSCSFRLGGSCSSAVVDMHRHCSLRHISTGLKHLLTCWTVTMDWLQLAGWGNGDRDAASW